MTNALTRHRRRFRKARKITGAFVWMGYTETMAYPLAFAMTLLTATASPFLYYFVGQLVPSSPSVGGDYFTFTIIGLATTVTIQGALQAFGSQLDVLVSRGTFESLLVEPVSWRFLPFAMVGWPIIQAVMNSGVIVIVGVALGVNIDLEGIPLALVVVVLGIACAHAVGVIAASIRVLSKRADPILGIYLTAAYVLSGVVFPISVLPKPLQVISYLIPLTYALTAMRELLMVDPTGLSGPSAGEAVTLMIVFLVVVYPVGLWLYGRALEYGRKLGVLAGY